MKRILVVGTGFMGSAVARAIQRADGSVEVGIVEKNPDRRRQAVDQLHARDFSDSISGGTNWAELVVLAVKPQDAAAVAPALSGVSATTPLLSVLAGTPISRIAELTGAAMVVRIMPNLAVAIGKAVTGISFSDSVDDALRGDVVRLLGGMGTLVEVREELMHAVTGTSGSGIAFGFAFVEALAMAGVEQGIPWSQALVMATDVVESAALLLREEAVHPAELVSRVCSPGGTTIAGVRALEEGGFTAAVMDAVRAAADRSRTLGA